MDTRGESAGADVARAVVGDPGSGDFEPVEPGQPLLRATSCRDCSPSFWHMWPRRAFGTSASTDHVSQVATRVAMWPLAATLWT